MPSIFDRVRANRPRTAVFDLSQEKKFSCDFGKLVPIYLQEVLPGDKFRVNTQTLIRLAPMTAPMMHRCNVYIHYFFSPNRLVWDGWADFITGGRLGTDSQVPPFLKFPDLSAGYPQHGSLMDFMGLPSWPADAEPAGGEMEFSELPFRHYQLIYNEYYRDQNLEEPINIYKNTGGVRTITSQITQDLLTFRDRCWERDYFTSALPFTQRGEPVRLPLGDTAPIIVNDQFTAGTFRPFNDDGGEWSGTTNANIVTDGSDTGPNGERTVMSATNNLGLKYDPNGSLEADLSQATASTINDLRTAFQLQKWLERNARAGSRYVEQILAHFGVVSSDARLQRPEYLGGGKSPIVVSEVLQTSESNDAVTPQGNMAGHGISVNNTHSFSKRFEEHGYIIGIMSVMPRTAYQQGLPRHLSRKDKLDYFWPEFANLGEQEVKNKELFFDAAALNDNEDTFGYQSRYAEYRYCPSEVHGDFKDSLSFWHMGRVFETKPELNKDFVHVDQETTLRPFAVEEGNHLWVNLINNVQAIRPVPKVAEPGFIDH